MCVSPKYSSKLEAVILCVPGQIMKLEANLTSSVSSTFHSSFGGSQNTQQQHTWCFVSSLKTGWRNSSIICNNNEHQA